jgi:ribosome-binding protein aMBF1 (putative translation factor)
VAERYLASVQGVPGQNPSATVSSSPKTVLHEADLELRKALGRNIVEARKRIGLSQRQLSVVTGMSQSSLSQVERGARNARIDNIAKIAQAVSVQPHDLLDPQFCQASLPRAGGPDR